MLNFITAGESHGPALTTIIEGLPAGMPLSEEVINIELAKRQEGYGRGSRMAIETDTITITSGVRHGKTLGSPVTLTMPNDDYKNWQKIMAVAEVEEKIKRRRTVTSPRPGHADLVGGIKYRHSDLRNVLERSSARETAMRVAVGAVCLHLLKHLDIDVVAYVKELGDIGSDLALDHLTMEELQRRVDQSEVKMIDPNIEQAVKDYILKIRKEGNTLGGIIEVIATNLPLGLGSYVHWDQKIDGKLAQAVMSINAFKGVEIGEGFEAGRKPGSEIMDPIAYDQAQGFYRLSNHLGGIEGGMTNGMPLVIKGVMKPIPTLYNPLQSVQIFSKDVYRADIERSDTTAVPAASIVMKSVVATTLANELLIKFPSDTYEELKNAVDNYRDYAKDPVIWQNEE